ncbi:MAG: amino acid transporter [Piscirickettsiaceae bacterium]|nr:MAG: amino acid transporter [Piscirickettsiaceae bacterium]PCI71931.1 MAG: amino acid transporter [Piscirickettsiaceae bacterium]
MLLNHLTGIFLNPADEWEKIRNERCSVLSCFLKHGIFLAAIPAISAYIGATQIGWDIGGTIFKLTESSTLPLVIGFYIASLAAIGIIGKTIHWMSVTYGADKPLATCVMLSTAILTPLFISGFVALIPIPWLIMLVALCSIGYSVYLLYSGPAIVLEINPEKGFLLASSVLTIALVTLVGILITTVIIWNMGLAPQHT